MTAISASRFQFIADAGKGLRPDGFFFMEMNTRLQVEHPVTEAITGLDLVELQLRVASGEKLPFAQSDLAIDGHAVEARLYAEDPEKGFLPSTGTLWALRFPEGQGLRIDTGVAEGDAVTPFYDPMIAKVIAHAPSRLAALDLLAQALGETVVAGPRTNVAFLKALCEARQFREGEFDTGFIDRNMDALGAVPRGIDAGAAAAGALALVREREAAARSSAISAGATGKGPWDVADAFQMSGPRRSGLALVVEGERVDAMLGWDEDGPSLDMIGDEAVGDGERAFTLVQADDGIIALADGRQTAVRLFDPLSVSLDEADGGGVVKAPMHGKVVAVFVVEGEAVEKGQRIAIVEAMKMEHALVAPRAGTVMEVAAEAGQQVPEGARLVVIGEED